MAFEFILKKWRMSVFLVGLLFAIIEKKKKKKKMAFKSKLAFSNNFLGI